MKQKKKPFLLICYTAKRSILFSIFPFFITSILAQVKLPAVFSDNMVLQREKPVFVWGTASSGEKITVQFSGQIKTTQADGIGKWQITLDTLILSTVPSDLVVTGTNTVIFKNVLVGDVWVCTGQSNMEYPMDRKWKKYALPAKGTDMAAEELQQTNKPDAIRYLYVEKNLNKFPLLPTNGWTNGDDTTTRFVSAIGYFFANEIYKEIGVPIGIISSSWGGTRIEQWTPPLAYKQSPIFKDSVTSDTFRIDGMKPGQMYKGMIEPLIPFAIKGILWYQGESNCMIEDQATYPEKFKIFVNTWRNLFKDAQLPFYTVQISPYLYTSRKDPKKHSPELLPEFWEAQTNCLKTPDTEMVVTTDLVDNLSDIHPSYKWIVGHRLAITALAKTYNKAIEYSGPVYQSMRVNKGTITLTFTHTGTGLASSDNKPLNWFTIAGSDGKFIPATAIIEGNKLIISSPEIKKPKDVRFAWNEMAQPNFINREGLPAAPFRTKL